MPIRAENAPTPVPPQPSGLPPAALWRPDQWRFHLYQLPGDGTQRLLEPHVPVMGPEVTSTLSGPDTFRGSFTPEVARVIGKLTPWSTAILAEFDDAILGMCILDDDPIEDAGISVTGVGFTGHLSGQPWIGPRYSVIETDPLDISRAIWDHVQAMSGFNLGLILDDTTSPERVGTEKIDVSFTTSAGEAVSFESGPYVLAEWKTFDLATEFANLANLAPFDYLETHAWSGPGSADIEHRLRLGYPDLGVRRHDLRFHIGENVPVLPQIGAAEYASHVMVLGAGEGSKKLRSIAPTTASGRLGRFAVVDDTTLDTQRKVDRRAQLEASMRKGGSDITQITVVDHPNAPFTSWSPGDHIHLTGNDVPWAGDVDMWLRVMATTYKRDSGTAELSVMRQEMTQR